MPESIAPIYRILDANANRAVEGLRVVEEYVRFVLDDRHLTSICKQLRHDLAAALSLLPHGLLMAARNTEGDVGTTVSTPSEFQRSDAEGVATAGMKRLEQSLRCLEEYGKVVSAEFAAACEQLRYRSYTVHRAISITTENVARLETDRLYVLIDGGASIEAFCRRAELLVQAGAHVLQLRDKRLTDRELLERGRALRKVTSPTKAKFIVNDRPDIAMLANADGVHVGQEELSVKDARAIVGPNKLVGVSTHSIEQARQAVMDGANYLGCGPTFPSDTKRFTNFPGIAFLRQVAAEIRLPAFAIGGITLDNLPQVLATGMTRVAVSGAVATCADPADVARQFVNRLR